MPDAAREVPRVHPSNWDERWAAQFHVALSACHVMKHRAARLWQHSGVPLPRRAKLRLEIRGLMAAAAVAAA